MTVTWLPSREDNILDVIHRLKILDRVEDALRECGIGGIYDDFDGLADAIEQMAAYVKDERKRDERYERDIWRARLGRQDKWRAERAEFLSKSLAHWKLRAETAEATLLEIKARLERERLAWKDWGGSCEFG